MEDTSKKFCGIIFDILEQKGVKDVVCSPGSRNVPLLLAASCRQSLKKHFISDERSAAFFGLGLSIVSKNPVALVCTSGTALLNYSPAIAEAYYQSIPLIVISADRPLQWIDQDDSQTLRQNEALANFVKKSYTIPADGEENQEVQWFVNRLINDAIITSVSGRKGPVHINVHLGEPLGNKCKKSSSSLRIIDNIEADAIGNKEIVKGIAERLSRSKILLVSGFNQPDARLQKAISDFSKFPNVAVMAETISNLHLHAECYNIDSVLTAYNYDFLDNLAPDVVISLGGALVSRKLKEYLRRNSQKCQHYAVGYSHTTSDPFMSLSLKIETEPSRFFKSINSIFRKYNINSEYSLQWHNLRNKASKIKNNFISNCDWSELKAFQLLLNSLPTDYNLFLSNGTAIRYAQIVNYDLPHASYCNRGVSGIDGSISTAIGGAKAFKGKTVIITGDLSMAYDIGALGIKPVPDNFKIVVIDNQGGGIFRFIPSTSELHEREEYLCQAPLLPLKNLAEGYGWDYLECHSESELKSKLPYFFSLPSKAILKVSCDGILSAEILKEYMSIKTTL